MTVNRYTRRYHEVRQEIIAALGGICVAEACGISDPRVLTIDHIHGGGSEERRRMSGGATYYRAMRSHLHDFQLLCHNHNHLKRLERGEDRPAQSADSLSSARSDSAPSDSSAGSITS